MAAAAQTVNAVTSWTHCSDSSLLLRASPGLMACVYWGTLLFTVLCRRTYARHRTAVLLWPRLLASTVPRCAVST